MMDKKNRSFLVYYDKYKAKIFNYCWYRINFDREIAEDLTSEIFIKAFSNFDSFDQEASFQAWIYAIAHNHLVNHYRKGGREVSLDEVLEFSIDNTATKVHASLEVEKILSAIAQMDAYSRNVLLMKYVDGLDSKEIAQVLGKNDGAVRTQLSRSLAILKEKLGYEKAKGFEGSEC
jgi:RNA polymerase sigma-70 factor (ECF subfamily)